MTEPTILWFRQDLRLADNHALHAAAAEGPLLALYVLDDETPGVDRMGGAQRWWLQHSLTALGKAIEAKGGQLILRQGSAAKVVPAIAKQVGATRVHAARAYEPWWQAADAAIGEQLDLQLHDGSYLTPPDNVRTGSSGRYRIFTPYWRALQQIMPPPASVPAPRSVQFAAAESEQVADWNLLPTKPNWAKGFDIWTCGEAAAHKALDRFADHVADYDVARNLPSEEGTSRLSPHLHFGEISPAAVWHKLSGPKAEPYLRELAWRDFCANSIDVFPRLGHEAGRKDAVRWRHGEAANADFEAWTRGQTGYPIVDAGMRQLWHTGWMHNRVRMIAASFLVKHLLIDWRRGARWFWDTLVDADYGNNSVNWQWISGSGVDASLFTRIMAPLTQSPKFDAADYIRQWVPELAKLSDDIIHDPHEAGVALRTYAEPLIGHREGRERALAAYRAAK